MAVNKLDPKVIFASTAPTQDTPAVFPNKTNGWGESRKNGGRPTIKQMNALQQETDLKILWLNENAVTPYDSTIDYPNNTVTIKDGTFKILDSGVWKDFISKDTVSKLKTIPTYYTAPEGVHPVTGVATGSYFNVRSPNTESYVDEYQNVGGVATPSGKSYPSAAYVQNVAKHTALPFVAGKTYDLNERVQLGNGDIVKSTVANNTKNPNTDMTGWELSNNAINTSFSTLNRAIKRVIGDRFLERVSIKDFGAIGDGTLHTLQEWVDSGKFSGLAAIQVVMPFVTSLTQSIDWAATQYCVFNSTNIHCPAGKYVLTNVVKTLHETAPYNTASASGVRIYGDGVKTQFTRNDIRPATYILTVDQSSTTQASDTANSLEACFAVHAPYTQITDMTIYNSPLGIYLGQDFTKPFTSLSSVSRSSFQRLQFNTVGTGILALAAGGNHYCNFTDLHFVQGQIDFYARSSYWWKVTQGRGDANNNRHTFTHIRSGRSKIGYWNDCGDTHNVVAWHGETLKAGLSATLNPFPMPSHVPPEIANKATLFVFTGSNSLNSIIGSKIEDCDFHLHHDGFENSFIDNMIYENLSNLVRRPKIWLNRYATRLPGIGYTANAYPEQFPEMPIPGALYLGISCPSGVRNVSNSVYHEPASNTNKSLTRTFQIEIGTIAANTPKPVTIWADDVLQGDTSVMIDVDVVARNNISGPLCTFNTRVSVNAYRNSARTLQRYGVQKLFSNRTTGENIFDTVEANHVNITIQKDPNNLRNLQIVLQSAVEITSATAFITVKLMR